MHFAPAGTLLVRVRSDDVSMPPRKSPAEATGAAPCSPVQHLAWDDAAAGFCKPTHVAAVFDDAGGKGWGGRGAKGPAAPVAAEADFAFELALKSTAGSFEIKSGTILAAAAPWGDAPTVGEADLTLNIDYSKRKHEFDLPTIKNAKARRRRLTSA